MCAVRSRLDCLSLKREGRSLRINCDVQSIVDRMDRYVVRVLSADSPYGVDHSDASCKRAWLACSSRTTLSRDVLEKSNPSREVSLMAGNCYVLPDSIWRNSVEVDRVC